MNICGIRFYFFSNEGPRPHIHVELAEYKMAVWLDDLTIKKNCSSKNVEKKFLKLIKLHQEELMKGWEEFRGCYEDKNR